MIKELADWLETKTAFVVGETLFTGWRPNEEATTHGGDSMPDRCAVIQETGGGDVNYYQIDMMWPQIQVITRGRTYFNARDDSWTIFGKLHGAAGIEFGTAPVYVASITAVNPPQYIGLDEERRHEFSTNYRVALYSKSGV